MFYVIVILHRTQIALPQQHLGNAVAVLNITADHADSRDVVQILLGRVDAHRKILAPKFPDLAVKVMWSGEESPGRQRARRLRRIEFSVFGGSATLFLLAAGCLVRRHLTLRRELQEQRDAVRDFSHRLKTPITSISLCAELARDGRVNGARKRECAETIFVEATKLDRIVGEVLSHIEGGRHG
jgi:signal transduction histidine kinase